MFPQLFLLLFQPCSSGRPVSSFSLVTPDDDFRPLAGTVSPVCYDIPFFLPADANIGAFCGAAKNAVSVIAKNPLTRRMFRVNKTNALFCGV